MIMGGLLRLAAVSTAVLVLASCSSSQDDEVATTASAFFAAVEHADGDAACGYLMPTTRQELEESSGKPCATELLVELPEGGGAQEISAFGTMAQVRTDGDTVFLHRFQGHWRVLAAGCQKASTGTYDCKVRGS